MPHRAKAAGSPPRPTLHVRPEAGLAGRARGRSREPEAAYHLPLDKVRGPLPLGAVGLGSLP